MRRVVDSAVEKGLAGVIVTPGPDLIWLVASPLLRPDGEFGILTLRGPCTCSGCNERCPGHVIGR
jgi:hypothetical protein